MDYKGIEVTLIAKGSTKGWTTTINGEQYGMTTRSEYKGVMDMVRKNAKETIDMVLGL